MTKATYDLLESLSFLTVEGKRLEKERQKSAVTFFNNMYEEVKISYQEGADELSYLLHKE